MSKPENVWRHQGREGSNADVPVGLLLLCGLHDIATSTCTTETSHARCMGGWKLSKEDRALAILSLPPSETLPSLKVDMHLILDSRFGMHKRMLTLTRSTI